MKIIYKYLILFIIVLISSCTNTSIDDDIHEEENFNDILLKGDRIKIHKNVIIDTCEYIIIVSESEGIVGITHKGNCKNH